MARREAPAAGPGSRALIVDLIRSAGPVSRAELVEITGLTQPSISNIVRELLADGIVNERGSAVSVRGKPRTLIAINPAFRVGIGFQLGTDTLTCVAIDLTGGVVGREVVPGIPDDETAVERLAEQFDSFVAGLDLRRDKIEGLAIVAPSPVPDGRATVGDLADLRIRMRARLGMPVIVENDAAAAALGEFWSRRVSREQAFGCIYVSTGIGAGFVFDGALLRGASSDAGELGHTSIHYDGRPCPCGNRGCVERYASMAATVEAAMANAALRDRLDLGGGTISSAYDAVARAAVGGDPDAYQVVDQAARYLAVATTSIVNLLDLGRVVLTGPGVALAGSIYTRRLRAHLEQTAHSRKRHDVVVELSAQPRDAAGIGAAALVVQASVAPGHSPESRR
jgi:predicted NBD/HSP70 family sugar kinase